MLSVPIHMTIGWVLVGGVVLLAIANAMWTKILAEISEEIAPVRSDLADIAKRLPPAPRDEDRDEDDEVERLV